MSEPRPCKPCGGEGTSPYVADTIDGEARYETDACPFCRGKKLVTPKPGRAELRARIKALEAENAALRHEREWRDEHGDE